MEERKDKLIEYDFFVSAMKRQIMNCVNKSHYRAGIYVEDSEKLASILDMIKDIISKYSFEEYLYKSNPYRVYPGNELKVLFNNGSSIIISKSSEYTRYRFNDVIYDHKIDNKIVNGVILESLVNRCDYSYSPPVKDEETRELFRLVECEMNII